VSNSKITSATVRADFNDPVAVAHYTRAAHFLGLWESERIMIQRFFTDANAPLIEAGCGAGRVTLGLHLLGYRNITAFDFATELVEQARSLLAERAAGANIRVLHADATRLSQTEDVRVADGYGGALFMFNGLMQIPNRKNRLAALLELRAVCRAGAPLIFTTHDREHCTAAEHILWRMEAERWAAGRQDSRLVEFGDRYFEDETGRTFMHLPTRAEILADLVVTGWTHKYDALRSELAHESRAVRDFSDECRFWAAVAS
jgi:SAM-dependent methyltransferase